MSRRIRRNSRSFWNIFRRDSSNAPQQRLAKLSRKLRYEGLEDRRLLAVVLDPYFGSAGKVTTSFNANAAAQGMAIQSDGKIVLAGGSGDFALARYNSDGSLDSSFDGDGKVSTAIGSGNDFISSIVLQSDGKLVVAGSSENGSNYDFALARYNPNGSLDTSFGGGDGVVTTPIGSGDDYIQSVGLQSNGKIVVAGTTYNGSTSSFALARYNSDGSLDTSFDFDGKLNTEIGTTATAYSLAIQSDGKLVAAGYGQVGYTYDFAIVRYNTDGSLDLSFDNDGIATTDFSDGPNYANDRIFSMAIQSDGKLVAAGDSGLGGSDFALARYNQDGSLDISFDGDGKTVTEIGGLYDIVSSLALQEDGKVLVAGRSNTYDANDFALARYDTDGTLDNSFAANGKLITSITSSSDFANSIALQGDGKIIAGGGTFNGTYTDFALVRYIETKPSITSLLAPAFASIGKHVQLAAVATDLNQDSASLTYDWTITGPNNFQASSSGINASFVPTVEGQYSVVLTVTDDEGFSATASASIFVENSAPTITSLVVPSTADQGRRVRLSARATDPNQNNTTLAYQWTVTGPGGFQTTSSDNNFVFIPPDVGTYTANLQVEDSQGATTVATADIEVVNEAPVITSFVVPPDANEGDRVRLSGLATDLNQANSALTFSWTVTGPGGFNETITGRNVRFTPPDDGIYNATFTATDNGGLVASMVDAIMVANVAPEITRFDVPATGLRNRNVRLVSSATDPAGTNDPLVYSWLITGPKKYRKVITGSTAIWKAPAVVGKYRVKLTVTDGDGGRDISLGYVNIS